MNHCLENIDMAFEFHGDKDRYFAMQLENAEQYVLPFIEAYKPIDSSLNILEIGCAEGGVLKAFLKKGCRGSGIELMENRLELAKHYLKDFLENGQVHLLNKNIYDVDVAKEFPEKFDIIILKDVIEHIPNQEKFLAVLRDFLKEKGLIFLGFPPWYMPFGGHQQICRNKWLSKLPYIHLLPNFMYMGILKMFGEPPFILNEMMDIKSTAISIERFEKIAIQNDYDIVHKKHYLINPIYKYKFKLEPREQWGLIQAIPFVRNFFTTCVYYLIEKK